MNSNKLIAALVASVFALSAGAVFAAEEAKPAEAAAPAAEKK